MEDRRQKKEAAEQKIRQKEEEKQKKLQKEEDEAKIDPKTMFLDKKNEYSAFDENGIPTHNKEGAELAKKSRTKVEAVWKKQNDKRNKWLAKQSDKIAEN